MTHARKTIRDAVVTQLTGLTLTGSNVFASRVQPIPDGNLPAIIVQTFSESVDLDESTFSGGNRKQMRDIELQLVVQSRNTSGEVVAAQLDAVAEDIEDAIYADKTFGGITKDAMYMTTEVALEPEADMPRGELTLTFKVSYRIAEPASGTIIQ